MEILTPTPTQVRRVCEERIPGFQWFDGGKAHNANVIALRTPSRMAGLFDDALTWAHRKKEGGRPHMPVWRITTDPGLTWLQDTSARADGIAVLAEGQNRNTHEIGVHKGYEAITQKWGAKVLVHRDANHDGIVDLDGPLYDNATGINLHRASQWRETVEVGLYSAGCLVHAAPWTFLRMLALGHLAADAFSNSFSVTVVHWPTPIWTDDTKMAA